MNYSELVCKSMKLIIYFLLYPIFFCFETFFMDKDHHNMRYKLKHSNGKRPKRILVQPQMHSNWRRNKVFFLPSSSPSLFVYLSLSPSDYLYRCEIVLVRSFGFNTLNSERSIWKRLYTKTRNGAYNSMFSSTTSSNCKASLDHQHISWFLLFF